MRSVTLTILSCSHALPGVLVLVLTFFPLEAAAHTPSETYLSVQVDGTNLTARWDVALRDLHQGMGLDSTKVPANRSEELQAREEALALDVAAGLEIRADSNLVQLTVTDYTTLPLNDVEYARLIFAGAGVNGRIRVVEINAGSVFRVDTNMHGLLRVENAGRVDAVAFNQNAPSHAFQLASNEGRLERWMTFIWEGVWHIWIGFDHILFLMALLLPAVLKREKREWRGVDSLKPAFMNVLKIVTAFTVAHSVTLTLAAFDLINLPTRLVESVIAASVAVAAANNLWPMTQGKSWMMAGGFGLIHGFGFASVLGDLGLESANLAAALVGFNLGVEFGQLVIVGLFLPWAFALRGTALYQTGVVKIGSSLIIVIALLWMAERMFGMSL
ncbi:MAG: HupE/UreJ family protein [Verrucomicrobia bacterium]|nr:HupE/UreJ family protein [Verrucomicrobiota bacterium]